MGAKTAGIQSATFIFVIPARLSPIAITRIEPVQVISAITKLLRKPAANPAERAIAP